MKKQTKIISLIAILMLIIIAIYAVKSANSDGAGHMQIKRGKNAKISEKAKLPKAVTAALVADTLYPANLPIEHIFFHPLVAYPEKAFDGDRISRGMDDYMATTTEFKRMLDELYKNDYILVDIEKVYERILDENSGKYVVRRAELKLPSGKKPFIISLDDMNYYPYMIENGCVHKLVVGEGNRVATYTKHDDGSESIDYDNEVIPILDNFVAEHPDFSLNGAKGCVGLTGFEGVLGYRTQSGSENRDAEIKQAKEVIKVLKDTGWTFASHSYGHPDMAKITYEKFKYDTDKWKAEVEPLIGKTKVLLYPYGAGVPHASPKMDYLMQRGGFYVFCGVGIRHYERVYSDAVIADRKNIDGLTLRNRHREMLHMFDTSKVIDLSAR